MRSRGLLLLAPLTWVACFSQSSGGSPQVDFDASFDATSFDAPEDSEGPEGSVVPPMDASTDAPVEASPIADSGVPDVVVEAGPPPPATVIVGGVAGFESGVPVVFTDATGATVYANTTTNAAGEASVVLAATGGVATVFLGTPQQPAIYTYIGLANGQTVLLADRSSFVSLTSEVTPLAEVTTVPAMPTFDGGIANYTLQSGTCSLGPSTLPLNESLLAVSSPFGANRLPCVGLGPVGASFGGVFPVIAQAEDSAYNVLGFATSKNNALSLAVDAGGENQVTLPTTWSTTPTPQYVAIANTPDGGAVSNVAYSEVADGVLTPLPLVTPSPDAGALPPDAIGYVNTHPGFADAVQAESQITGTTSNYGMWLDAVVQRATPPASGGSTMTLDQTPIGTAPAFVNVTVTAAPPSADGATPTGPAQPMVSWALASGDFGKATGIVSLLNWNGASEEGGTQTGSWTIVSPGTAAGSVQVPSLPSVFANYLPAATTNVALLDTYVVYGQTAVPNYESLLSIAGLFQQQMCSFLSPFVPPLPFPGTALVLAYGPAAC